eukprot:CAMPEP_0201284100 /NCGR_PEP_ID=MMETSP1317-20130820/61674_1 /ASSEMBLY_ACC=CAM_ASM_000770 /TAXON_ID=187299 /ORGANISM="Undescribed Undescribed, Strain Undescribed" /LENGTH=50 /DNA_ID=CAMNT_0047602791 /DNA_START=61 /DNA_END=213 /DNA_ORIENTATION=-
MTGEGTYYGYSDSGNCALDPYPEASTNSISNVAINMSSTTLRSHVVCVSI